MEKYLPAWVLKNLGLANGYPLAVEEFVAEAVCRGHLEGDGILRLWVQPPDVHQYSREETPVENECIYYPVPYNDRSMR